MTVGPAPPEPDSDPPPQTLPSGLCREETGGPRDSPDVRQVGPAQSPVWRGRPRVPRLPRPTAGSSLHCPRGTLGWGWVPGDGPESPVQAGETGRDRGLPSPPPVALTSLPPRPDSLCLSFPPQGDRGGHPWSQCGQADRWGIGRPSPEAQGPDPGVEVTEGRPCVRAGGVSAPL